MSQVEASCDAGPMIARQALTIQRLYPRQCLQTIGAACEAPKICEYGWQCHPRPRRGPGRLRKIDQFDWVSSTCELGLLIGDKKSWGKGVGTEACQLSISYAFEKLNMRKVSLTVYANNPNAIALYEKIGFKHEGRLKDHVYEGGTFHDKLWMSIFNPKSV